MSATQCIDSELDPDPDLIFFRHCGLKKLGYALVANSLRDLLLVGAGAPGDDEMARSARWLETDAGREWLEFLIPASADAILVRLRADPKRVLDAINEAQREVEAREVSPGPARPRDQAASASPAMTPIKEGGVHQIQALLRQRPILVQLELDLCEVIGSGPVESVQALSPQMAA